MSRQFWDPKYTNHLISSETWKHVLSFGITYQEAGTVNGGKEYAKTMVVDSDEAGWKPFDVTEEFRAALDSGIQSASDIEQADYCLAHGYFTAHVMDQHLRVPVLVTPDGIKTYFLLAVLVRLKDVLFLSQLQAFLKEIKDTLGDEWHENTETVFPQRLLVVLMQPEEFNNMYIIEDQVTDQHHGIYMDLGFKRPVTPRAPKKPEKEQDAQDTDGEPSHGGMTVRGPSFELEESDRPVY
ncbi:hypothetical protein PG999_003961 [Apiospora kogelbergensis]|uniref:Uncharacterized protein n=1 Tax=Apiospora kogelbergensis TaxID=1337665 RepID=A0AAW0R4X1_9PEZI